MAAEKVAPCLVGIDIGTTNWKVGVYDHAGRQLALCRRPAAIHHEPEGRAHYDPEEIWRFALEGLADVVRQLGGREAARRVVGVAVTSMGEAGVLLDGRGAPVYPAIAWFDPRTQEQVQWWQKTVDPYRLYEITGFPLQPIPSLNKILWIARHEPARFAQARRWLCLADYVAFRLSGHQAMDFNLASRTMAFDVRARAWSGAVLEMAGIDPSLMPPAVPSGTLLGTLRREVAEATGLPASVKVAAGGQDHWCGALAAGVVRPGDVLDSTGTAEAVVLVVDRPVAGRALFEEGFALGCHTVPGLYYLLGGLHAAGGTIEWLRELFAADAGVLAGGAHAGAAANGQDAADGPDPATSDPRAAAYRRLMEMAARAEPGCRGLLFLPHLRGATHPPDPHSRGAWVGLRPFHGPAELVRSAIEGLAHEFARAVDRLEELSGTAVRRATAIGGGTRNELWLKLKADIGGRPLEVVATEEATTLGAAVLAGVAAGVYRDAVEGADRVRRIGRTVEPDPQLTARFGPYRDLYRRLYPALAPISLLAGQAACARTDPTG